MRKLWQFVVVAVVGLGVGLAIVGCSSSKDTGKDKMGGDKMEDKKGDKMGGDKKGDRMGGDKMDNKMDNKMDKK